MMKGMVYMKNRPAPLIIALILIIAGFGIPIMTKVYWVIPPVLNALIILGAIILLVVLQRRRTAEKTGISEELCSDIHSVLFSSGGRNFVIRSGKRFSLSGETNGILSFIDNGIWTVSAKNAPELPANAGEVIITVPQDTRFKDASVEAETGSIILDGLYADNMKLDIHGGSLDARGIYADNMRVGCGQGKIVMHAGVSGDAVISCGSGKIDAIMKNSESDFNIYAQTGMGEIKAAGRYFGGDGERSGEINNGAKHSMQVSCGMGNVDITFGQVNTDE